MARGKIERSFFGDHAQEAATYPPETSEDVPAGWYQDGDGLRYWNGSEWTAERAPITDFEPMTKTILWAMSLASGVAGVLAWGAPVLAFYWPLGLGGASLAFAIASRDLRGKIPWYGVIAVIAALVSIGFGISGYSEMEDARSALDEFP